MTFTIAFNYGGRAELVDAIKAMMDDGVKPDKVNEKLIRRYLYDPEMPDPDLMVRTSGESRISNYLLWELAYSELVFTETLWPDFRREHLFDAVRDVPGARAPVRWHPVVSDVAREPLPRRGRGAAHVEAGRGRSHRRVPDPGPRQGAGGGQGRAQDAQQVRGPPRTDHQRGRAVLRGSRARHRDPGRDHRLLPHHPRRPRPVLAGVGHARDGRPAGARAARERARSTRCSSAVSARWPPSRAAGGARLLLQAAGPRRASGRSCTSASSAATRRDDLVAFDFEAGGALCRAAPARLAGVARVAGAAAGHPRRSPRARRSKPPSRRPPTSSTTSPPAPSSTTSNAACARSACSTRREVGEPSRTTTWRDDNRAAWDERVPPARRARAFYDNASFVAGRSSLRPFELDEVGPVAGKTLCHLQCHFGQDTLVVGPAGRAGRRARLLGRGHRRRSCAGDRGRARADVPSSWSPTSTTRSTAFDGRRFDIVYTGLGALVWHPRHRAMGAGRAPTLLEPGGFLYLAEMHPFTDVFDGDLKAVHEYFTKPDGDHSDRAAAPTSTSTHRPSTTAPGNGPIPISSVLSVRCWTAGLRIELVPRARLHAVRAMAVPRARGRLHVAHAGRSPAPAAALLAAGVEARLTSYTVRRARRPASTAETDPMGGSPRRRRGRRGGRRGPSGPCRLAWPRRGRGRRTRRARRPAGPDRDAGRCRCWP